MTEDHSARLTAESWSPHDDGAPTSSAGPDRTGPAADSSEINTKLSRLYRDHKPTLTARLRKAFGNGPPDPDDITQLAFQKLIERGDISDITSLEGFLWRTARNLFLNDRKRQAMRSRYDFEIEQLYFPLKGDNSTPEIVIAAREELSAISKAFEIMPERRRRAFILHRVDGLSVSEVARRLRIARSPADRHIRQAMEDIQVALAKLRKDSKS